MAQPKAASRVIPAIAILGALLSGCQTLDHRAVDRDFPGLDSAMQKPIVCILFVHGMGGYSNDDPQQIINGILKMPHIQQTAAEHAVAFADPQTAGTLTRQDFVDSSNGHELRAYTLHWAPVTQDVKTQYLEYDQAGDNTGDRVAAMNAIRAGILDASVPDVILYVGAYKAAIQRTVREALKTIQSQIEARPNKARDYEYFIVTWSLGSKIIFDCLADPHLAGGGAPATTEAAADDYRFNAIAEKTHSVFMLANQIPLLTLGDVKSPGKSAQPPGREPAYQSLLSVAGRRKRATSQPVATTQRATGLLSIVAVSDPNDVLSYPIPPWLQRSDEAHFANVSISIARTAYYIPFLGWIVNPVVAHTGYGVDERVIDLIIHGSKGATGGGR